MDSGDPSYAEFILKKYDYKDFASFLDSDQDI